jgi:RsiW-degrading membrane proteinase PrsW (M82 family)
VLLFALGAGVYREEDMFSQRAVHLKALDALANYVSGLRSVATISALSIPFVFVAQLLTVAMLFAIPRALALPALLLVVATVEELAKSLHVYAGYEHSRYDRSLRTALAVGFASGAGFFVGEKITPVAQFAGLTSLDLGQVAFNSYDGVGPALLVALFLMPLALHAVTAIVSAVGARRGPKHYLATLVTAISLHAVYNLGVMTYVG